ncbi:MAG: DUF3644 domain-containing protein [Opitutaceae bacterium]
MKYAHRAKEHLAKSRDSALLAVEFYNKPAVTFKTAGYITMMSIAWTSLFHAIFFKKRIKPFYKLENGRYDKRENDFRYWELATCIKEYFGDENSAIRSNISFFIPLRNKIEHRSMPKLDPTIFGECQSLLLNFDSILTKEFGEKSALKESLSFSLQIFPKVHSMDLENPNPEEKDVVDFITSFRSSLSGDVYSDTRFAFKAFLIRVGNHNTKDAVPIKFVDYESLSTDQRGEVNKLTTLIKTKEVPVGNLDQYNPCEVVSEVQRRIGDLKIKRFNGFSRASFKIADRFNTGIHTLCWKRFKARPESGSKTPEKTNRMYCIYDKRNRNYGYTKKWIDLLVEKISNDKEYLSFLKNPDSIELIK